MIHDESKTLGEYEVVDNSIILIVETKSTKLDIGVFDSHHLGSSGRERLMQTEAMASKEEVKAIIEGLGASQTAQVQVITPVKGLNASNLEVTQMRNILKPISKVNLISLTSRLS